MSKFVSVNKTTANGHLLKYIGELSSYSQKEFKEDGSFIINNIENPYFLKENDWKLDIFCTISNFSDEYARVIKTSTCRNLSFSFMCSSLSTEVKFIFYKKIFNDEWRLNTAFGHQSTCLRRFTDFINKTYPKVESLLELDPIKTNIKWINYLQSIGVRTHKINTNKDNGFTYETKTQAAAFFNLILKALITYLDDRIEWEKDRWDMRNLYRDFGISYNESKANYYIYFSSIENPHLKDGFKRYTKQRLLSGHNFTTAAAQLYSRYIPGFINLITSLESDWNDFHKLNRNHILQYIEYLNNYTKNFTHKRANPEKYKKEALNCVSKFLRDSQMYEYDFAPKKSVSSLIYPEDKPTERKKAYDQVDYIPEFVSEQLFNNISDLHPDVQPITWIAFKTGLRISDTLGLTHDCLVKLNDKYQIVTDIEKTYVKGHSIPIDDHLANIIAVLIDRSKQKSNNDNNPKRYIFVRYVGARKGKPYYQHWVAEQLNALAVKVNIVDESGKLFHFTNHQFRHTYAIKLLNSGTDILTVQELMAHASPEMTMRYARLLDGTKREAFENAINQGVFSFDLDGTMVNVKKSEEVPEDVLEWLWRDHKLTAIDNPYGSCRARLEGDCPYAEEPPCLTCNGGSPCKDLAVGLSEMDIAKYDIHIESTKRMISVAKEYGRDEIAQKNKKNLDRLLNIYNTIKSGNIVFGRLDRVKRKQGVFNA
ncbi:site-specific integrase [Bacillus haynesii]|uniref:tyrosine-type recombinase/integrase n=1 Tax=Bacillus haynesii TaxID=1925021 RepID=UPI002DBB0118|nr:site-specific integrase [Bacillus haynesii]MEC1449034.1 site-specific integrase [Bacillus haynesii]